jgi:hypothetical protein
MEKKLDPKEHEDLLNEVDREIDEAMATPGGLQKYIDDLEEFYNNIPEEDLNEALDSVEYNAISTMLKWSEEDMRSKLAEVPSSVLREYIRFINLNKNLQEGNNNKITLLFELLKESEKKVSKKRPHDINQVFLCGWIAKDSSKFTKSETNYGCKFTVAVNSIGRSSIDENAYTTFLDIEYRGKNALSISPYLIKGKRVSLTGKIKQYRWEQEGEWHSRLVILASEVLFFDDTRNEE